VAGKGKTTVREFNRAKAVEGLLLFTDREAATGGLDLGVYCIGFYIGYILVYSIGLQDEDIGRRVTG
jgi:hypothetical protein